jgi:REP element-mobilizing transposase RayT
MAIAGRQRGWLNPSFHHYFRDLLGASALRYGVAVPAYCLMPDHLHLLVAGITEGADQLLWAKSFRRALNRKLAPRRLQKQAYDHLLRPDESNPDAFASLSCYIGENPVRAGLVSHSQAWAYSGACIIGRPDLDPRQPGFYDQWWEWWNASGL